MTVGLILGGGGLVILLAGWVGYPLVLRLLAGTRGSPAIPSRPVPDTVAVVIATREAPAMVRDRVLDLLQTAWPADRLAVVIGVDVTAAHGLESYRKLLGDYPRVRVVAGDDPGGKAVTLNAAMRDVEAEVVVFADSAQTFEPTTIPALVEALRGDGVGGATGQITTDVERGIFGMFWRYELLLRRLESRLGIVVAVTGAVHGMRREAWQPLPAGLICDDLLIPLRLGRDGRRVVVAERALARDPRRFSREMQLTRKVRTLTGMLQVCAWEPWVLVPWAHRMWSAFLCHKLIRVATPALAAGVALSLLSTLPWQWIAWMLLSAAVCLACVVVAARGGRSVIAVELLWTLRLLLAPLTAIGRAIRGQWDVWVPHVTEGWARTTAE